MMQIIKKFIENKEEYQILTLDQIYQQLNDLDISSIEISDGEVWNVGGRRIKILANDYDNPIVIKRDGIWGKNYMYINPQWYEDNKVLCEKLFQYICENIKRKKFNIDTSEIINSDIIDALCRNNNLEEISLAQYDEENYVLSVQDYEKFKKSNIKKVNTKEVEDSLKENFDPLIGYNERRLILYYNYEKLQKESKIYISEELTKEEVENFKYIPESLEIIYSLEDYDLLIDIIKKLKELNKGNKIIINPDNKEKFNNWILNNNIDYENIIVKGYSLKEYLRFEKILYDSIKGIDSLSPFEKYIYIYNITKKYKKYKENEEDKSESRDLYKILENEYMVCVGFSHLLGDLLNKKEIQNVDLSVSVDISYDKERADEENFDEVKLTERGYHARRMVHIVDEKYGIDGFFISDPTWDNDIEKDLYSYLAMTNDEATRARRYLFMAKYGSEELLNVNSIEEFYNKINFRLSRVDNEKSLKDLIYDLIYSYIGKLDSKYVLSLKQKYDYISSYNWPDDISDLVYEIGEYLVSKVNKEISAEVIISAVSSVYKNVYGYSEEEWLIKREEIVEDNKKRYSEAFPKRYRINEDGSREVIMNEENKFDVNGLGNNIVR